MRRVLKYRSGRYQFLLALLNTILALLLHCRWLAPISVALFAPGYDLTSSTESILYVRNCLPESDLIRKFVSFHLYFPRNDMPLFVPIDEVAFLQRQYNCTNQAQPPYIKFAYKPKMYKSLKNLTYPINVGRNIARKAVNTYFVFACDIELYPSLNLIPQFLQMISKNTELLLDYDKPM